MATTKKTRRDDDDDKPGKDKSTPKGHKRDTSTTAEGEDEMTDATAGEMNAGAASGAAVKTAQNPKTKVKPEKRGKHVPAENFREAVHQSAVTRVDEDLGIGPRDPYPTGDPPDPREAFHHMYGYYPKEDE